MSYKADKWRYDRMPYNRCGNSGLKLPALSLGFWQNFGNTDSLLFEQQREIVLYAFDHGITYMDLANNYGPDPGSAEINLGKIFNSDLKSYRDQLVIATKAGHLMWEGPYGEWGSRKNLLASLDQSLSRMKLDYVDIFYSHRYDPDTPLEETMGALDTAVRSGKALYAGISKYPPVKARQACQILKEMGTPAIVHQVRYSMFVREPEKEILELDKELGLGTVSFSPLAQGLLTDKYLNGIPAGSRAGREHSTVNRADLESKLDIIARLNELALTRGQSLAQMAIAWQLYDHRVCSVLVGASSKNQLADNIRALDNLSFSDQELERINAILNSQV